jgi:hypothetical protein
VPNLVENWILAIGVYVMSVNKSITQEEFSESVQAVWPVQIEPGSLADKLLEKGRGKESKSVKHEVKHEMKRGAKHEESLKPYKRSLVYPSTTMRICKKSRLKNWR